MEYFGYFGPGRRNYRGSASVVAQSVEESIVMRMCPSICNRPTTHVLWVVNGLDQVYSPVTFGCEKPGLLNPTCLVRVTHMGQVGRPERSQEREFEVKSLFLMMPQLAEIF